MEGGNISVSFHVERSRIILTINQTEFGLAYNQNEPVSNSKELLPKIELIKCPAFSLFLYSSNLLKITRVIKDSY